MRKLIAAWKRRHDPNQFQPVPDPAETYSPWDTGWLYGVAWIASILTVLLGLAYLTIAMEVLKWWIAIVT